MDISKAGSEADETFSELLDTFTGIEEDKINKAPFEGSWTPGQLAQHIVLSAGAFVNLLNGPVKETERDPEANVGILRSTFLNFDTKMTSPDFIVPEQKNYDRQNLTTKLTNIKAGLLDAIQTKDMTKTCTAFELPRSGYITAAEATTFTIVHTKRHVHQLKNIVAKLT